MQLLSGILLSNYLTWSALQSLADAFCFQADFSTPTAAGEHFWAEICPAYLETTLGAARKVLPCNVPSGRLERPANGLGNRCSIHLSYEG